MVVRSASRGQSLRALDWLNVFLADIQGGVGPFQVVYLTSSLHWNPAEVGLVMTISGLAGVVAQTPVGALIDQVRNKRSLIVMMIYAGVWKPCVLRPRRKHGSALFLAV